MPHPFYCCRIYRGEWENDRMRGCGVRLARSGDGKFSMHEGQFVDDEFVGPGMTCPVPVARQAAADADTAAAMARAFQVPCFLCHACVSLYSQRLLHKFICKCATSSTSMEAATASHMAPDLQVCTLKSFVFLV